MLRTSALRRRTRIVTTLGACFGLWSALGSFSLGTSLGFCFCLDTGFFLRLTASGFFTFLGAACIFFSAALGFFSCANAIFCITNQRAFERTTACVHFGARQRVQHHARAIRLARTLLLLARALLMTWLLLC